jgi:hypothetical protein
MCEMPVVTGVCVRQSNPSRPAAPEWGNGTKTHPTSLGFLIYIAAMLMSLASSTYAQTALGGAGCWQRIRVEIQHCLP